MEDPTLVSKTSRLDIALDSDCGFDSNLICRQKNWGSPTLAHPRSSPNSTFRIRKSYLSHLPCFLGLILEGGKVRVEKVLALVHPLHCLVIDSCFGFGTTPFEWRSIAGDHRFCDIVLCKASAAYFVGNAFSHWRNRLPWTKAFLAPLSTGTMGDRKLVSVAKREDGRPKTLSSSSSVTGASSGRMGWKGVFPKPTKTLVPSFRS